MKESRKCCNRIYFKQYILWLVILFPAVAFTQAKVVAEEEQLWFGYFNQVRFSNKWGVWTDVHVRTKEHFFNHLSQAVVRSGLTYYLSNDVKLTAGYAYFNHFPADNHKSVSQPEHRLWQQLQWDSRYPRIRLSHRLRIEERFRHKILNDDALADGYYFNFRFRYNILSQFALNRTEPFKPGSFSLVLSDEIMANAGREIVYNVFDQNRFFAGFHYHVSKRDNLQFGYMNLFQQQAAGNRYRNLHVARLFYFHQLDLRKHALQ